jgi:hypothetical protein
VSKPRLLICLAAVAALALPARAHRLDEYLQATRIDLSSNRVDLEIDLTPGVEVVDDILPLIDANHDGRISKAEGMAYAKLVLKTVVLTLDQQRHDVKLTGVHYPAVSEMKAGTGIIHLKASASFAPVTPGPHQLYFQNPHQTNLSVYLINAYVPKSPAIQISGQKRDQRQTEIWIDFTLTNPVATPPRQAARPNRPERDQIGGGSTHAWLAMRGLRRTREALPLAPQLLDEFRKLNQGDRGVLLSQFLHQGG